jgi:hypothetical protein
MILENSSGKDYLDSIRNGTFVYGLKIGCDLDNHLRYKQGSFNVMAGHANVGKTKFILYYYLCLAVKHKKKFLIFSSENSTGGIKRDLIQLHAAKKLEDLTEQQYEYHFNWIGEHFKFIDFESFYKVNNRFMNFRDVFKTALDDCDYFDALVVDPYNSLATVEDIKGNAHERDYAIAQEFRMFCRINNKTIYLLAHGNTEALRKTYAKDHDFYRHPIPLMASDIEGGGKWVNRADDFIVIHRLTQHESEWMKTEIHVRKIKETETGGVMTFLDSPVIFEMDKVGLGFICYIRQTDFREVPHNATNPLSERPQVKQIELKPNKEFDKDINHLHEPKKTTDDEDWLTGYMEEETFKI